MSRVKIVREYLNTSNDSKTQSAASPATVTASSQAQPRPQQPAPPQQPQSRQQDALKPAIGSANKSPRALVAASTGNLQDAVVKKLDFEELRKNLIQSKQLYEDPKFPAEGRSIFPSRPNQRYVWKRPKEICQSPMFISDGVSRFDVKQGELGDCWLLASIASLSMNKSLFDRVVPPGQDFDAGYCGMFRFRFWHFGRWKEVVVDDRLPTKAGRLCFMRSQDRNEFWSALLEKAYAKVNGSYEALTGGSQSEAMEDFTGGLCENFDLNKAPADLFNVMFQANKSESLMGCSIESEEIEGELDNGLITGHAYSVTDVRNCKLKNGQEESLVRVRNPWGNECEWKGDWSDRSPLWNQVNADEKSRLKMDASDDGEFWMAFKDFVQEFTKLEICHLCPETMSGTVKGAAAKKRRWEISIEKGEWKKNVSAGGCRNFIDSFHTNQQFRVEIVDPDEEDDENLGTIIVGLMQKDVRKVTVGGEYFTIGYAIYQLRGQSDSPLDQKFFRYNKQMDKSAFVNQREVSGRHKLPPGRYVIVPSTFNPNEEAQFIMRMFSEKPNLAAVLDSETKMEVSPAIAAPVSAPENEEPLRKAFQGFSGGAGRIHAFQLQQILNRSFGKEVKEFSGFSAEACRSMLALMDLNMSGYMEFDEFKVLWNQIRLLKTIFKEKDADGNGSFDSFELRDALKAAGYNLSNKVFETVAMRYTDPTKGVVSFEDFILLSVRMRTAFTTYEATVKTKEALEQDNFIKMMMYI
ncbi:hypothetical protein BOX15_Mlig020951g1 [Macrostomum lignano]|uniref:Calpain catalytic domain-containing protein n=1 Tax=Macrostomum lignano TaxID=282301 RepID=A0A267H1X1_9PLAT|nr:hypothetical protein BOX15_Mlig020951g1 [Macrostomum lignano]